MFSNVVAGVNQALMTAQVYGILLYQARVAKQTITYSAIAKALKIPQQWGALSDALTVIAEDDHKNGRPILSSLVVSVSTGIPGQGYWDLLARLGDWAGCPAQSPFIVSANHRPVFWREQFDLVIANY